MEFRDIVYSNSRKSREPPNTISGDETISHLYTRKDTVIRMRTSKKNDNLCGSNEGYANRKEGDPKAGGFTYANIV